MCACVCACVYVNKEKVPCSGFSLTPHAHTPFIGTKILFKRHVGLYFLVLSVHVTWRYVDHPICALNDDR